MRAASLSALVAIVGSACAAEPPPAPPGSPEEVPRIDLTSIEVEQRAGDEIDLCALADALPLGELCSLVCDPDAFAAQLAEDGMQSGTCLQVRCELAPETIVSVGVCVL